MLMSKPFNTIAFICRAQPMHNGHFEIIRQAAELADQVVILVGSVNQPRTFENPFTFDERRTMIIRAAEYDVSETGAVMYIEPIVDTIYNNQAWASRIQGAVNKYATPGTRTGLIGHKKEDTEYYLSMFPQWEPIDVELIEPLNATMIRDIIFRRNPNLNFIRNVVPTEVLGWYKKWSTVSNVTDWNEIVNEREYIENYKKPYAAFPYKPYFITTDALVICSGHILLVTRRSYPGKGLLALPGGFLNQDEFIIDGTIRELREETKIKVPAPVLKGNITKTQVFDHPKRSARGRVVTHCSLIELPPGELPKVKGSDDASKAQWVPLSKLESSKMFEDHYQIISVMLGI